MVLSVASNILITKHFIRHPAFKTDVDVVTAVIGKKLPDDLIESFAAPIRRFIRWANVEQIHSFMLMNGLTQPKQLAAIVAHQVAIDAQWTIPLPNDQGNLPAMIDGLPINTPTL